VRYARYLPKMGPTGITMHIVGASMVLLGMTRYMTWKFDQMEHDAKVRDIRQGANATIRCVQTALMDEHIAARRRYIEEKIEAMGGKHH